MRARTPLHHCAASLSYAAHHLRAAAYLHPNLEHRQRFHSYADKLERDVQSLLPLANLTKDTPRAKP